MWYKRRRERKCCEIELQNAANCFVRSRQTESDYVCAWRNTRTRTNKETEAVHECQRAYVNYVRNVSSLPNILLMLNVVYDDDNSNNEIILMSDRVCLARSPSHFISRSRIAWRFPTKLSCWMLLSHLCHSRLPVVFSRSLPMLRLSSIASLLHRSCTHLHHTLTLSFIFLCAMKHFPLLFYLLLLFACSLHRQTMWMRYARDIHCFTVERRHYTRCILVCTLWCVALAVCPTVQQNAETRKKSTKSKTMRYAYRVMLADHPSCRVLWLS